MANGTIKLANKRFTTIPHDFCLGFEVNADIFEVDDEKSKSSIKQQAYSFKTLKEVKDATHLYMLDLIGVITEVQNSNQYLNKATGQYKDKRRITLADDTGFNLEATLWGESASQEFQVGQILAVKGARHSDYGGKSLNIDMDHCVIQINPEDQERYIELLTWYKESYKDGKTPTSEKLTNRGQVSVGLEYLPIRTLQ